MFMPYCVLDDLHYSVIIAVALSSYSRMQNRHVFNVPIGLCFYLTFLKSTFSDVFQLTFSTFLI